MICTKWVHLSKDNPVVPRFLSFKLAKHPWWDNYARTGGTSLQPVPRISPGFHHLQRSWPIIVIAPELVEAIGEHGSARVHRDAVRFPVPCLEPRIPRPMRHYGSRVGDASASRPRVLDVTRPPLHLRPRLGGPAPGVDWSCNFTPDHQDSRSHRQGSRCGRLAAHS